MQSLAIETKKLLGIELTPQQVNAFDLYEKQLLEWNEKFNLTAIRDADGIRIKHFLDSLSCSLVMKKLQNEKLIDIGTGAGFPGIPLKILFPGIKLTLVESVGKKANFCTHIVNQLHLQNVDVLVLRAEEVGRIKEHREKYDWALARAVAGMPILAEYLLPLVKIGGRMLAQKGENAHAETQSAENAFKLLGGELEQIQKVILPGVVEERFLVTVKKLSSTPAQYPRTTGIPAKKPL